MYTSLHLPDNKVYYRDPELLLRYMEYSPELEHFKTYLGKKHSRLLQLQETDALALDPDARKKHQRQVGYIKQELTMLLSVVNFLQVLEERLEEKHSYESRIATEMECNKARDEVYANYFLPMLKKAQFFEMAYYAANVQNQNKSGIDQALLEDMMYINSKAKKL